MADLKLEKREIVKVIILNSQNVVIKTQMISYGATNSAIIDPKDIFSEAIKIGAPKNYFSTQSSKWSINTKQTRYRFYEKNRTGF